MDYEIPEEEYELHEEEDHEKGQSLLDSQDLESLEMSSNEDLNKAI